MDNSAVLLLLKGCSIARSPPHVKGCSVCIAAKNTRVPQSRLPLTYGKSSAELQLYAHRSHVLRSAAEADYSSCVGRLGKSSNTAALCILLAGLNEMLGCDCCFMSGEA